MRGIGRPLACHCAGSTGRRTPSTVLVSACLSRGLLDLPRFRGPGPADPGTPRAGLGRRGRPGGHSSAHRGRSANVGAQGLTLARSRGGRLGRAAAGTPAPCAPAGEDARDADGGRRTTGAACPARRGTGARRRRPGSGAAVRGSRGGPSSRTRPAPRRRQRSCITPLAKTPQKWRNPAVRTQSRGAVSGHQPRRPMGYPAPLRRRTLRRVARPAQHRRVRDVERRTACGERHDVVDGQVGSRVGGALVARTPVAVLATPGAEHAGAESLPGPRAVQRVVAAAVGLAGVLGTAATLAAGDDTADRAQLHQRIVGGVSGAVYSLAVLRLRDHASQCGPESVPDQGAHSVD